ncbi:tryptophan halogenase family protein [Sphingomonas sp. DT-51]|uniref:tryptophan halogenase family protein n=1 Tax=Sphingomonas sp. DT-51 TaxID=3396165 RepID=UPI003F1AA687
MVNDHTIRDVVILGGGTAGWMAAAALARFLDNGVTRITLVESEEIGTVGVGEATIPPLLTFNQMLGIDEDEFLRATRGTYKLGIEFADWGALGERYLHPFGAIGRDLQGIHFHQLWLRERERRRAAGGEIAAITSWSVSGAAAAAHRFARPGPDAPSPWRDLRYAFHFDAALYAAFLRRRAEQAGVIRVEGRVENVEVAQGSGHVASLRLAGGRVITGDLFVDCSGFAALLIERTLATGYEDWSHWLPCDRAIAVPCALSGEPEPYTRATARAAGWQWRIPLQHRLGNGYVYASRFVDDATAQAALLAMLERPAEAAPRRLAFTAGRRRQAWNGNVVSLGLASGFVEPLESTSIHLVQAGIAKLIALFPDRRFDPEERAEYNRHIAALYEDVRDFIILHYKATRRTDTPFWDYVRTMEVPETLRRRIALFAGKGRVFRDTADLFTTPSWVAVALGQGLIPADYEPAVDALDEEKVAIALDQLHARCADTAARLPSHAEYLRRSGILPAAS